MRSKINHAIAAATAALIAVTAIAVTPAGAAASPRKQMQTAQDGVTDVSARRYRHGNAAVVGAAAAIFGTIASIAAANAYRDRYPSYGYGPYYGPYYGPRYYHPYAYGPYPYYGPRW